MKRVYYGHLETNLIIKVSSFSRSVYMERDTLDHGNVLSSVLINCITVMYKQGIKDGEIFVKFLARTELDTWKAPFHKSMQLH